MPRKEEIKAGLNVSFYSNPNFHFLEHGNSGAKMSKLLYNRKVSIKWPTCSTITDGGTEW